MQTKKLLIALLVSFCLVNFSCKKTDEVGVPEEQILVTTLTGFGSSTASPTGTEFKLPTGVTYTADIKRVPSTACTTDTMRYFGVSGLVPLLVSLRNNNSTATTVSFPRGLVFKCQDSGYQNGILLQDFTTTIPANTNWCVHMYLACTNFHRHVPTSNEVYGNPVITNSSKMHEVMNILKTKQVLRYTSYGRNLASKLQSAIWNITDYSGLTTADLTYLNGLPNR